MLHTSLRTVQSPTKWSPFQASMPNGCRAPISILKSARKQRFLDVRDHDFACRRCFTLNDTVNSRPICPLSVRVYRISLRPSVAVIWTRYWSDVGPFSTFPKLSLPHVLAMQHAITSQWQHVGRKGTKIWYDPLNRRTQMSWTNHVSTSIRPPPPPESVRAHQSLHHRCPS